MLRLGVVVCTVGYSAAPWPLDAHLTLAASPSECEPMGDPGPGGTTTHRADEAQEPSPGEGPVGDGCSSRSDRHSLSRVERGTVRQRSTDNQPTVQESVGWWESSALTLPDSQGMAPQVGLSPMLPEGQGLPQGRSL